MPWAYAVGSLTLRHTSSLGESGCAGDGQGAAAALESLWTLEVAEQCGRPPSIGHCFEAFLPMIPMGGEGMTCKLLFLQTGVGRRV